MSYSWRTKFTETEIELISAKNATLPENKRFSEEELAKIADRENPPQGKLLYRANDLLKDSIRDKDQLEGDRQRYLKKPCTRGEALYFAVESAAKLEDRLEKAEVALGTMIRFVDLLFAHLEGQGIVTQEALQALSETRPLVKAPEEQSAPEVETGEAPEEQPPVSEPDQP